jgi:hypothetical protein
MTLDNGSATACLKDAIQNPVRVISLRSGGLTSGSSRRQQGAKVAAQDSFGDDMLLDVHKPAEN